MNLGESKINDKVSVWLNIFAITRYKFLILSFPSLVKFSINLRGLQCPWGVNCVSSTFTGDSFRGGFRTKIARRASTFIVVRKLPLIGDHGDQRLDRTVDNSCESTRALRTGKTAISSRAFQTCNLARAAKFSTTGWAIGGRTFAINSLD